MLSLALHTRRGVGIELRGAYLEGRARLIFVLVIIPAVLGDDLDDGEGLSAEDSYRELAALDVFFNEDVAVVAERLGHGGFKALAAVNYHNAYRRTRRAGLDDAGEGRPRVEVSVGHEIALEQSAVWGGHVAVEENALGDPLVHRYRGSEVVGTGVSDSVEGERRLDGAVLSLAAVEAEEGDIGRAADL